MSPSTIPIDLGTEWGPYLTLQKVCTVYMILPEPISPETGNGMASEQTGENSLLSGRNNRVHWYRKAPMAL